MLGSVKEYASSMQTKLGETYTSYTSKDKIDQLLIEATSNDQWSVSNQKLLQLADATHGPDGIKIVDHLIAKLKSPAFEYRRILKSLNLIEFLLKNGNLNVLGKVQMTGQRPLTELQTFEYKDGSVDQGKQIRDKAYLVMDLMHNRHKLEAERDQATEYRKKFYSNSQGGFQGAGGASFSNTGGEQHGYSVPTSYQSSYNAPTGGDGVSRVYSPYNPASDPVLKVPTAGALKWGAGGQAASTSTPAHLSSLGSVSSSAPGQAGSTYNITNNNNINYNYGSNITAISSEGAGSVPTFHDIEKAKKEAEKKQGYLGGAMGYVGSAVGSVASGLGGAKSGVGSGLSSVTESLKTSKGLASMSDSVKRATGLDIHGALGGKTAVQLAEERLKKEQDSTQTGYGGGYGYQGISIPLDASSSEVGKGISSGGGGGYGAPSIEKLNVGPQSKYNQQWGTTAKQEEAPKYVPAQKLFQGIKEPTKKRLDEDSDSDDDKPVQVSKKEKKEKVEEPKKQEVDLLDIGANEQPKDLLSAFAGPGASTQGGSLLEMGQPNQAPTDDLFGSRSGPFNRAQPAPEAGLLDIGQSQQTQAQQPSGFGFMQQPGNPQVSQTQNQSAFQVPNYTAQPTQPLVGQQPAQTAPPTQQPNAFTFMNQGSTQQQPQPLQQQTSQTSAGPGQGNASSFGFMQQAQQPQPQSAPFTPAPFGQQVPQQQIQQPQVHQQQQQSQINAFSFMQGLQQPAGAMTVQTAPAQAQQPSDPFGYVSQPAPVQQPQMQQQPMGGLGLTAQMSSGSQGQQPAMPPGGNLFSGLSVGGAQEASDPMQTDTSAAEQDKKPKDAWAMGAKLIKF